MNGYSTIENCINIGSIEGLINVGGIVGWIRNVPVTIININCINYGRVMGIDSVGGILGVSLFDGGPQSIPITNSINTGVIIGGSNRGCIAGSGAVTITNC